MDWPRMVEYFGSKENENEQHAGPVNGTKADIAWVSQNRLRITLTKVKQ